ncbi:hypothetical protein HELRODRAFT_90532, partial [Helobdella robusta]|uniref:SH2 domain-containing protein n=1 Tax=Helobdella robusta TaxID=6412 RepID=T1G7S8_HELRO
MFHSNKLLTCPLGLNPVLNSPLLMEMGASPWYHGLITRSQAEQRLEKSGDFLVRNSPAAPGEIILTFKMNSDLIKHLAVQSFLKHKYESFLSVTSLIEHHVVNKKPIISSDS